MRPSLYKELSMLLLSSLMILSLSPNLYAGESSLQGIIPVVAFEGPQAVVITGILQSAKGPAKPGLGKLKVFIGKEERELIVKDLQPTRSNATGSEILNQIFPPRLRIIGKKEVLKALTKHEIKGKLLRIEGDLYVGEGILMVTSEEEVQEQQK
jgi:hypothetical protein